jgi:CRP-like cAMP-binding protein
MAITQSDHDESAVQPRRVPLLEADPELGRYITREELPRARRAVTAPLLELPEGCFDPVAALAGGTRPFGALVLSGLIARELTVGGQPTLRLLGPGDVIQTSPIDAGMLVAQQSHAASLPSRLAILDDHFLQAVRHWPRLLTALMDRVSQQHDATLVQMAISQQPRVEDRLVALFRSLAERWGRMTSTGVIVPLSLTHEALGRLIGARRPTVTLALKALAANGALVRRSDGAWQVADLVGRSPAEEIRPLSSGARPRLVEPGREPSFTHAPSDGERRLIAEVQWLRINHEMLRARMAELAARNQQTWSQTRDLVARSRAERERRAQAS